MELINMVLTQHNSSDNGTDKEMNQEAANESYAHVLM